MSVPSWAVVLTIELIILLILIIVFLAIGWRLSCRKKQKLVDKLQTQLSLQNKQIQALEDSSKSAKAESAPASADQLDNQPGNQSDNLAGDQLEEVELLKIQLQQARDNPFLQEKIDALTAENEDLQAQLNAYKASE